MKLRQDVSVTLPELAGLPKTPIRGRTPYEGYQRGWGLQFGDLAQQIEQSPLFKEACTAVDGIFSHMTMAKRMNLYLIISEFLGRLQSQNIVEFGVYKGSFSLFAAHLLKELHPEAKVFALDTFAGMPITDPSRDAHGEGDFSDTSAEALAARRDELGLTNLIIVKGLFQDTFPAIAASDVRFGLSHIDCDIYSAVKYAQDACWPCMAPGAYVVYDDADISSCIGATEAVEELVMERRIHCEQAWPHFVFRAF